MNTLLLIPKLRLFSYKNLSIIFFLINGQYYAVILNVLLIDKEIYNICSNDNRVNQKGLLIEQRLLQYEDKYARRR